MRADFAPEIWSGLGVKSQPSVFALSETWVALGVAAASGLVVLVRDNRRAFFLALALSAGALGLAALSLIGQRAGLLSPFAFMVLLGIGMYVPYVCVHTTIFERLLALTRETGNIGFLMYLADAAGYIGYTAVMLGRSAFPDRGDFAASFLSASSGWLVTLARRWILITAGLLSLPHLTEASGGLVSYEDQRNGGHGFVGEHLAVDDAFVDQALECGSHRIIGKRPDFLSKPLGSDSSVIILKSSGRSKPATFFPFIKTVTFRAFTSTPHATTVHAPALSSASPITR